MTINHATLAFILATCTGLSAQPPRPPQGMGPHGPGPLAILRSLELSEAQRASVHAILDLHRAAHQTGRQAAAAKDKALMDAAQDPATTEARLRALGAEAGEARLQALLAEHALVREIAAVLKPEQLAKAKELREKLRLAMQAHQAAMEALGGPERPGDGPGAPPR